VVVGFLRFWFGFVCGSYYGFFVGVGGDVGVMMFFYV